VLVVAIVLAGIAARRRSSRLSLAAAVLMGITVAAWIASVRVMGAKPS
jgi:hypothetical protein